MATSPGFAQRLINVEFRRLDGSSFTGGSGDTLTLTNHRALCRVTSAMNLGELDLQIFGLTGAVMADLSTLGQTINLSAPAPPGSVPLAAGAVSTPRHQVIVTAGDSGKTPATVFDGTVVSGWFDAQSAPDVIFRVAGSATMVVQTQPSPPKSFAGAVSVVSILGTLAGEMNLVLEADGVSVILRDQYLYGTVADQLDKVCKASRLNWMIDGSVLAVWPVGTVRTQSPVLISPTTGMIGYPSFDALGISVKTLFNPSIILGGQIQVVQPKTTPQGKPNPTKSANGIWNVYKLDHNLDALMPNGLWHTQVFATPGQQLGLP